MIDRDGVVEAGISEFDLKLGHARLHALAHFNRVGIALFHDLQTDARLPVDAVVGSGFAQAIGHAGDVLQQDA